MKKTFLFFVLQFIIISSILNAQSVDIGLRFESFAYSLHHPKTKTSDLKFMPIPLSGYLKACILFYDKYEVELKTGVQIIDPFTGPEYAVLFKYGILKNIFPLFTYMSHSNVGNSHTSGGTYDNRMDFIGFGVEAKLINFFNLDLVYYIPFGKKKLEYGISSGTYSNNVRNGEHDKIRIHF